MEDLSLEISRNLKPGDEVYLDFRPDKVAPPSLEEGWYTVKETTHCNKAGMQRSGACGNCTGHKIFVGLDRKYCLGYSNLTPKFPYKWVKPKNNEITKIFDDLIGEL